MKLASRLVRGALFLSAALIVFVAAFATRSYIVKQTLYSEAIASINDTVATGPPDEAASQALIVLDGATQLRREPGVYGAQHVGYALIEPFPAAEAIQAISSRLDALAWNPLQDDWLSPASMPSHERGWTRYVDSTRDPTREVHQWSAQWQDESGNVVEYSLRYTYPKGFPPDLQSLWINGSWTPAAGASAIRA